MTDGDSKPPLSPQDYEAIEAAVMETARGRWFLSEYARRNRHADTTTLLAAISRLEDTVREQTPPSGDAARDAMRLRREIRLMADTIGRTRGEIAATFAPAGQAAMDPGSALYDALVESAEASQREVFGAAERVQEIAWLLRESGQAGPACDELDRRALDIYRASSQHALNSARVRRLIGVLRFIEGRLQSLISEPDAAGSAASPRAEAAALVPEEQGGVVFVEDLAVAPPPLALPRAPVPPARDTRPEPRPSPALRPAEADADPRLQPFAAIDALDPVQKLALFV
ncbi:hypothetical protein NK718_02060 [Alsobacter sp. SYSU M60028]|uniref:Uncharacterized protein n=1 Tax=Alsobacter ponti TaxID=2962936 RepID=A0ABT1L758_9HYPH|nr:hypothetical protein [Alsobacter ponti]MCP8937287.1 hypothetical protein [Alsobacter ponti]